MAAPGRTCQWLVLFVVLWSVIGNAWWWHYKHAWSDYDRAVLYWERNCQDKHAVLEEGKVDDCHAREHIIDAGVFWVAVEALVRGFLTSIKVAIWNDFLNESVVKLIFTLFGLVAVASVAGLLYLFQRDLESKRTVLLPSHSHGD